MTIANIQNYYNSNARIGQSIALTRAERISVNEREIVTLENEIAVRKNSIKITEDLIVSNNKKIEITEQLIAAKEKLVGTHGELKGLMIEARDLAIEARDATIRVVKANDKIIALETKRMEDLQKMMDIVKNMHSIISKYTGLSNTEIQKKPEITESKAQFTQFANSKIEEYPEEIRPALTETAKKVIDVTFTEINSTNPKANRELFINLGNRIAVALDKKYEILRVKDFEKIIDANYKSMEMFFRIKRLDYLNLALRDIKV